MSLDRSLISEDPAAFYTKKKGQNHKLPSECSSIKAMVYIVLFIVIHRSDSETIVFFVNFFDLGVVIMTSYSPTILAY